MVKKLYEFVKESDLPERKTKQPRDVRDTRLYLGKNYSKVTVDYDCNDGNCSNSD